MNYARQIKSKSSKGVNIIDRIYNTEEGEDLPFIGLMGLDMIEDYLDSIIDTAKNSIISFLPAVHYTSKVISILKERKRN
ncbi:MAG: hypothetical protein ACTSQP_19450 [Promethearchaeota archaeon]